MHNNPKCYRENIVIQELETELLIYDLNINKAYCLNHTSAMVWQLSDGENSVTDISRLMSQKLKTPISEDFVWLALDRLQKADLLDKSTKIENEFNGLTRRQIIRKVGLTSMIAMPMIASVVAPTAVNAQSQTCLPLLKLGCSTFPDNCCSGSFCQGLLIGNACCVPTNTDTTPGFRCAPDAATCNSFATLNCCSGMANFGALALCVGSPIPGDRDCTCSENSTGFIP